MTGLPYHGQAATEPKRRVADRRANRRRIKSARRNTACTCVHSRTDKEHCDLFLDTSPSMKIRRRPFWMVALNGRAFLGTSHNDVESLEGRLVAEIRRTPHPSSAMQASTRRLLHPAGHLARAPSSNIAERMPSLGSFLLWTRGSDPTMAERKPQLRQRWLPPYNSFRGRLNERVSPLSTSASVASAEGSRKWGWVTVVLGSKR